MQLSVKSKQAKRYNQIGLCIDQYQQPIRQTKYSVTKEYANQSDLQLFNDTNFGLKSVINALFGKKCNLQIMIFGKLNILDAKKWVLTEKYHNFEIVIFGERHVFFFKKMGIFLIILPGIIMYFLKLINSINAQSWVELCLKFDV